MAQATYDVGSPAVSPRAPRLRDPRYQAFLLLWVGFTVAPILFGLDKFFHLMVDWDKYLSPRIESLLPIDGHTFMLGVGVVEVIAGLAVALRPRFGGYLVSAWLFAIVLNLLSIPGFYDIALRDFGLALGAFSLARQAQGWRRAASS